MGRKQIVTSLGVPKKIKKFINDNELNLAKFVRIEMSELMNDYSENDLDKYRGR